MSIIKSIDLHGLSLQEAQVRIERTLFNAIKHNETVIRIIHGQGKHSAAFPVIKSYIRNLLEKSEFSREYVEIVYRGDDGSPYTLPNPGETIVQLKSDHPMAVAAENTLDFDDEEERESRRNSKAIRADRLRTARRRNAK